MSEMQVTDLMADQAIVWFARLRADDVSEEDRQAFVGWLREHRLHQHAFIEILNLWEDLAIVGSLDFRELQSFTPLWKATERFRVTSGSEAAVTAGS